VQKKRQGINEDFACGKIINCAEYNSLKILQNIYLILNVNRRIRLVRHNLEVKL
jgi:hypothetical protein